MLHFLSCSATVYKEEYIEQILPFEWSFRAGEGDSRLWAIEELKESDWTSAFTNSLLSDQELKTEKGYGWYRTSFSFNSEMKIALKNSEAVVLNLGRFAACEEVYFNGRMIGKTGDFPDNFMGYSDNEREYTFFLKKEELNNENILAIKFHDGWSTGGFLDRNRVILTPAKIKDKVSLNVDVASHNYIFFGDEPLSFNVGVQNMNKRKIKGNLIVSLSTDDYRFIKEYVVPITINKKESSNEQFMFSNLSPGFYRCNVKFVYNGEDVVNQSFNLGYEPEKIDSKKDNKTDLREFWEANLLELSKIAPDYQLTYLEKESTSEYNIYLVTMRSFGSELIQGYYAQPNKKGKHPVIVEYMGYGSAPYLPNREWDGFAHFVLSIRGQGLNEKNSKFGTWITYGLDSKESYYYRGAFLDVVRAIDFVCSRSELDESRIGVRGGSQGGALSFVAAALDSRVKVAAPSIPFLSDYRDYFRIVPWPKKDIKDYLDKTPSMTWEKVYSVLSYFDIKNLSSWIKCPVLMGIGVQDEVCPPHINFAAYNQVQSQKKWMAFPNHGHSVGKEFYDESMRIFREVLDVNK